ncbi:MAG: integrase, partial [Candidatus Heimdallarchaeota archaeon]
KSELLNIAIDDIDFTNRMLIPAKRMSETKHSWVSFFNEEAESFLKKHLASLHNQAKLFSIGEKAVNKVFRRVSKRCDIRITTQMLREWFCCEMGRLGVPDRYVDAFCGRIPNSVLAKHYTDYSPEKLQEIYEKANLKVFC